MAVHFQPAGHVARTMVFGRVLYYVNGSLVPRFVVSSRYPAPEKDNEESVRKNA